MDLLQLSQQGGLGSGLPFHPVGAFVLFPVAFYQDAAMSPKLESGIWLLSCKAAVVLGFGGVVSHLGLAQVRVATSPAC